MLLFKIILAIIGALVMVRGIAGFAPAVGPDTIVLSLGLAILLMGIFF